MIFSPVLSVSSPFSQAELDAINIFARFSSSLISDIDAGLGGDITEFDVNQNLLAISKQLYYCEPVELDIAELHRKLTDLESDDLTLTDSDVICGSRLLYLVLACRGDEIMESISENQYQVYREVLIKLQALISK